MQTPQGVKTKNNSIHSTSGRIDHEKMLDYTDVSNKN